MAEGQPVRVMSEYAPGEKETAANEGAFHGPTGEPNVKGHAAISPNLLIANGGNHWYNEHVDLIDKNTGEVLRKNLQLHDWSYWNKETPTKNSIELADDHELGNAVLVHAADYPDEQPTEHERNFGKISDEELGRSQYRAPTPEGAVFKRPSTPVDFGATHKRAATDDELAASHAAQQQAQQAQQPTTAEEAPTAEEPTAQPAQPPQAPTPPQAPAPQGAQPAAPISQVDQSEDPNDVLKAHSAALDASDSRVTRRINPDTGSNKIVGQYFVPGDPVHETYFLSGLSPEDQAKLPWISNAIGNGGPFSYLYDSAQQYRPGSRVTGQSRAMEQAASTAQQRISGEHEAQMQRVTMLPMQMMATEPGHDEEGNVIPSNLLLEGFGSDAVMNNARHLLDYSSRGTREKVPVPYTGLNDFNLQRDVSGYLENQRHGFRGDGSQMLDENGQPHPLWQANQQKPMPYVPHLLDRPRAEFVHAMMNIRAPKNPKPPTAPPGFGERAAWQRRVNEGYAGSTAGVNNLLAKLDKRFPEVPVYRERKKKNKETGEVTVERYVHHHAPFSEASILEPTWRAYRIELMHHGVPEIGTESLRGPTQAHLIHTAPEFKQTLATYRPHQGPGAAPISENPEVGSPLGAGYPGEKIRAAAVRYHGSGKIYSGPYHKAAETAAARAGEPQMNFANAERGYVTTHRPFVSQSELYEPPTRNNIIAMPPREETGPTLLPKHPEARRLTAPIPLKFGPAPIGQNPEVGAPLGEKTPQVSDPAAQKLALLGLPDNTATRAIATRALRADQGKEALLVSAVKDRRTGKIVTDEHGHLLAMRKLLGRPAKETKPSWEEMEGGLERELEGPKPDYVEYGYLTNTGRYATSPMDLARQIEAGESGGDPIGSNPEVGAPLEGEAGEGGEPGALSQEATSQEETPQIGGSGGGMDFASPAVRENMTMKMAKLAFSNPKSGHQQYRDFNNNLEQRAAEAYGSPTPETRDAYGSWKDGAENSLRLLYGKGQGREERKLVNAIRGLHSAQKQVLNFHYDEEGPNRIAHFAFHHDDPKHVADLLDKHGIEYRTLEAPGKGQQVWAHMVDSDGKLYPKLEKLIKGGHVADAYYRRGHADFIGDPNGEDREAAARRYRQILGEARDQADKRWQGRGNAPDTPRPQEWWEPFADQAEQNYQKLKAGDELKKQQLALDLKRAKADRENITPTRRQELANIQGVAQNWLDKNPDLHPLAVHHYLPGGAKQVPRPIDPETGKEVKPTNEDIAAHFEERNPRLDYSNEEHRKIAADALTHDIMHNLATNPASFGWYDTTVDKAMDKIAEVAPEIKTDAAHEMAMKLAMAVTSQGQKVVPNFESAYKIYQYWKEHGKFPVMPADEWNEQFGGGPKRDVMIKNFQKLNDLWGTGKDQLNLEQLQDFLKKEFTVGDLKREHDLKVSGESVTHKLPGAAFLGPKIGIFYSNLNKIFHHTTMDLWFSRTMNRMAGNMFKFSPEALTKGGAMAGGDEDEDEEEPEEKGHVSQLQRLRNVMDTDGLSGVNKDDEAKIRKEMDALENAKDLTRLQAMKLAPTLTKYVDERHKFYQKSEGLEGSYHKALKTEENLAAKNIDLNFHGTADAPRNSTERENWRKVMDQVHANLKDAGLDVNHADKQALLWYLEQHLFQGPEAKSSMDYLDAAHVLTRKVKNGEI